MRYLAFGLIIAMIIFSLFFPSLLRLFAGLTVVLVAFVNIYNKKEGCKKVRWSFILGLIIVLAFLSIIAVRAGFLSLH